MKQEYYDAVKDGFITKAKCDELISEAKDQIQRVVNAELRKPDSHEMHTRRIREKVQRLQYGSPSEEEPEEKPKPRKRKEPETMDDLLSDKNFHVS